MISDMFERKCIADRTDEEKEHPKDSTAEYLQVRSSRDGRVGRVVCQCRIRRILAVSECVA